MGPVTLAELRQRVRRKVDMEGSEFVTEDELTELVNRAIWALDDELHNTHKDWFLVELSTTLSGDSFALPAGFYRLMGVDVRCGGGWEALQALEWAERNDARNSWAGRDPRTVRYRLQGALDGSTVLRFVPAFTAPVEAVVSYYPQRPALVADADTVTYPQGWENWAVLHAALEVRTKEERDTSSLERLLALETERLRKSTPQWNEGEAPRMVAPRRMRQRLPGGWR